MLRVVRLFISIFTYFICIVCILLSAVDGVINDDDVKIAFPFVRLSSSSSSRVFV